MSIPHAKYQKVLYQGLRCLFSCDSIAAMIYYDVLLTEIATGAIRVLSYRSSYRAAYQIVDTYGDDPATGLAMPGLVAHYTVAGKLSYVVSSTTLVKIWPTERANKLLPFGSMEVSS